MRLRLLSLFGDLRHVPPLRGMRRFGVPPGGPSDGESAALAAALGGSPANATAELAFGEATFSVEEGGTLAIVGAGRAERRVLAPGEIFSVVPKGGARLALASPGGWSVPPLGVDPELSLALHTGDTLESSSAEVRGTAQLYVSAERPKQESIRVVAGPQRDLWTGKGTIFPVSPHLDRHGIRIGGAPEHRHDIASEPCVPGVIQWTPSGELIALGPDGPTIGGYPKPFVAITADLPKLGQLLPGRTIRLIEISLEEAREANRAREADLARRLLMIRLAG